MARSQSCLRLSADFGMSLIRPAGSQVLEGGTAESAGMGGAFAREAGHLSARHGAFLAHWHRLLDLEEAGLLDKRAEVWRLHGALPYLVTLLSVRVRWSQPPQQQCCRRAAICTFTTESCHQLLVGHCIPTARRALHVCHCGQHVVEVVCKIGYRTVHCVLDRGCI